MGILDTIQQAMGGGASAGDTAKVGGGLLDTLREQPGGIGGMLQSMHQNGMGGAVQQWAGGQTAPASPDQVQQGLGGTGLIDQVAARTGHVAHGGEGRDGDSVAGHDPSLCFEWTCDAGGAGDGAADAGAGRDAAVDPESHLRRW